MSLLGSLSDGWTDIRISWQSNGGNFAMTWIAYMLREIAINDS